MRFTVLNNRHHKVSSSSCIVKPLVFWIRGQFVMSITKNHESHYVTVLDNPHPREYFLSELDISMIAHSLFNEHYKGSNLTGIVAWSALGKRKLTSEKRLFSKANHCFSQFLTAGAVGELGRIEGCSHPAMISAGQPKGWNPCVLDGGSWLTLRWLLSSFNVSWRISIFSNDSPCGQTSWSPRWN